MWASLQRDAALDLREICLRLERFNLFSGQGNTLLEQSGYSLSSRLARLPQGRCPMAPSLRQGCLPHSQGCPGSGTGSVLQSLQLARGQWFSCPCRQSLACWEVWLSIGMLECHRHVSINVNMNCMNWSCFEGCITCILLLDWFLAT